ncbi:hypothetical protein PybrP1_009041 [[Pythium] brassicae (nom. inval.)]|nr:hypothetical protein PybrP1_009041 [[Pythium] brassicae (nom. inval.)]
MGLLPQLRTSASKALHHHREQPQKRPAHSASKNSSSSNNNNDPVTGPALLPKQAQQLKDAIIAAHPVKLVRFSFSHMRHMTTPPVDLPANVASVRAKSTVVAGRNVPFTRSMHANAKKKITKRRMGIIDEYVQY